MPNKLSSKLRRLVRNDSSLRNENHDEYASKIYDKIPRNLIKPYEISGMTMDVDGEDSWYDIFLYYGVRQDRKHFEMTLSRENDDADGEEDGWESDEEGYTREDWGGNDGGWD